jgi:hypothetical protein
MVVNGYGWHERKQPPTSDELLAANRNWYLYMIDRFTPARCMFESNFPVDRLSCSYTVLWNQFKKLTKDFSAGDRSAMFHDTASRYIGFPERDACAVAGLPERRGRDRRRSLHIRVLFSTAPPESQARTTWCRTIQGAPLCLKMSGRRSAPFCWRRPPDPGKRSDAPRSRLKPAIRSCSLSATSAPNRPNASRPWSGKVRPPFAPSTIT